MNIKDAIETTLEEKNLKFEKLFSQKYIFRLNKKEKEIVFQTPHNIAYYKLEYTDFYEKGKLKSHAFRAFYSPYSNSLDLEGMFWEVVITEDDFMNTYDFDSIPLEDRDTFLFLNSIMDSDPTEDTFYKIGRIIEIYLEEKKNLIN